MGSGYYNNFKSVTTLFRAERCTIVISKFGLPVCRTLLLYRVFFFGRAVSDVAYWCSSECNVNDVAQSYRHENICLEPRARPAQKV